MTGRSDDIRDRVAISPFHTWMGMRLAGVEEGAVELTLDAAAHHRNLSGLVHGGVLATLADTAAGLAVRSALPPGSRHVTVDLHVQYLRAARGGTLTASGRVTRVGRAIAFAGAEVTSEDGAVVARAQVTMAVSPPRA